MLRSTRGVALLTLALINVFTLAAGLTLVRMLPPRLAMLKPVQVAGRGDVQASPVLSTASAGTMPTSSGLDGALGSVLSSVSPLGNVSGANASDYTTTYAYNSSGLMKTVTDPDGNTTSYAYTPEGLTSSVTDPDGNTTSDTYDADERLVKEKAPGVPQEPR